MTAPSATRRPAATAPAAAVPALCAAIGRIAEEQYRRWRPGGGAALTETSAGASPILREYYRVGVGVAVSDAQLRDPGYQSTHPWSAVFISYVVRSAGAGTSFTYSALHQSYVRAARASRLAGDRAARFWAYRTGEIAPRVGDLVCAARAGSGATYDTIGGDRSLATHCDVVTAVEPGRVRVVGGNVGQTVGAKWLRTGPDGRLDTTGSQSSLFAVVRCRDGAAEDAPQAPVSADRAPQSGLHQRVRRVMTLLVTRYRYPANAAAGLAGNLWAESELLPNRLEGSTSERPMTAPVFASAGGACTPGRKRPFSPEQVRDRDRHRGRGPCHPGVGIAQWTAPNRRRGLFQHVVGGRRPGAAILHDLDAQVDYLVTELRRDFSRLDRTLRSPSIGLDQASDAVLLRFERPAAVLNRPAGDPTVQKVLRERRGLAARALRIHRTAGTP